MCMMMMMMMMTTATTGPAGRPGERRAEKQEQLCACVRERERGGRE